MGTWQVETGLTSEYCDLGQTRPPRKSVWDRVALGLWTFRVRNGHPIDLCGSPASGSGGWERSVSCSSKLKKHTQTLRQLMSTPHRMHLPAVPSVPAALPGTGILWILKFETQNTRHSESARGAEKLTASVLRFYTSKAQKVNAALHYRAVFNYSGNYPPFLQCTWSSCLNVGAVVCVFCFTKSCPLVFHCAIQPMLDVGARFPLLSPFFLSIFTNSPGHANGAAPVVSTAPTLWALRWRCWRLSPATGAWTDEHWLTAVTVTRLHRLHGLHVRSAVTRSCEPVTSFRSS